MRTSILAALLLSGCFDLEALGRNSNADQAGSDLATTATGDLGAGGPDLRGPVYWVSSFKGAGGAKALRGIGGAGGTILAVGDGGTCLLSTDGRTWSAQNTGTNANFLAVWASAAKDAWLVGNGGSRIYHYDGQGFPTGSGVPGINYTAVFGVSASRVIAVGADPNKGAQLAATPPQWMPQDHNYNQKQNGMWGMTSRLWTVGENATGGYYDFTANSWSAKQTIAASANTIKFQAVWGSADTDVWAVGDQGNISHYSNGSFAAVFSSGSSNLTANLNGVWGLAADNIWAVGDGGVIVHYNGTAWQPWTNKQDIGAAEQLLAIWGDGTNLWTVSAQGNIFRYQ